MTVLVVITSIATILSFIINLFKWLKIQPNDLKQFIVVRGKTITWSIYILFTSLISVFFITTLYIVIPNTNYSLGLIILVVLIFWGLIGIWTPAIQRLNNNHINNILQYVNFVFFVFMVVGYWIVQWPKIYSSIIITLVVVALIVVYLVPIIKEKIVLARVMKRMKTP